MAEATEGLAAAGTIVFKLGYDGAAYSGFAEQPSVTTVAGELRRAIETFVRRPVELTCAGRTDAGVHAIGQYVSFPALQAELEVTRTRWLRAMDALLPRDIALGDVFHAGPEFSARFDAQARTYTYRIADRPNRPVLTRDHVWWHRMRLDEDAMAEAAQLLYAGEAHEYRRAREAQGEHPERGHAVERGLEHDEAAAPEQRRAYEREAADVTQLA